MEKSNIHYSKFLRNLYNRITKNLKHNIYVLLTAFFLALSFRHFFMEAYKIPSGSMTPSLIIGDHLMVNKLIYGIRFPVYEKRIIDFFSPNRGDIVVFKYPKYKFTTFTREFIDFITLGVFRLTNNNQTPKNFIKRLIAIPGDTINLKNQYIYINKEKLPQSPVIHKSLWSLIKDINPIPSISDHIYEKDETGIYTRSKFYQIFQEKINNTIYTIQKQNTNYPQVVDNLPILYVPKKNDLLELIYNPDNKMISMKFNKSLFTKVYFYDFFFDGSRSHNNFYSSFYNEYVFNNDAGLRLKDSYIFNVLQEKYYFSHKFQKDYFFMIGDNRHNSSDSRDWGFVSRDLLIGKPMLLYYPFSRFRFL